MPIYEYKCQACGKQFEEMQKFSDAPLTVCPNCGKPDLKKLMSHTSFQLKGGGYYATDYKKPSESKDSNHSSNEASKETSKETTAKEPTKETTKTDAATSTAKETSPTKKDEKKSE